MTTIENIIYNRNDGNTLIGGTPINSLISTYEMTNRMYYGGNNQQERFKDLIIPVGLVTQKYNNINNNYKIIKDEIINENIFNELFDKVCKKRTSYKNRIRITKKNKTNKKK